MIQPPQGGDCCDNAFVAKIDPSGSALLYSTKLGGGGNHADAVNAIAVDAAGRAYVVGTTYSVDFPLAGALQTGMGGTGDAFIATLSPSGSTLLFSTLLGGKHFVDDATAIALDSSGHIYVAGVTQSTDFPTVKAMFPNFGAGWQRGWVARISAQAGAPAIRAVTNAASYATGGVAPGELVTLFGSAIGPERLARMEITPDGQHLSAYIGATRVLFDGEAAPLLYASSNQTSAVVPYRVAGKSETRLEVEYDGVKSAAVAVPVFDALPGIFTLDSSGQGQAAVVNEDGSTNSASSPAPPGSVIVFWATGAGQTDPPGQDGWIVERSLPKPRLPVSVTIGGEAAEVLYAAAAPSMVSGVLQVNARVPAGVAAGKAEIRLTVGGRIAAPVTINVGSR
jgi:uncharacterized protein (TIGR03437 family)